MKICVAGRRSKLQRHVSVHSANFEGGSSLSARKVAEGKKVIVFSNDQKNSVAA